MYCANTTVITSSQPQMSPSLTHLYDVHLCLRMCRKLHNSAQHNDWIVVVSLLWLQFIFAFRWRYLHAQNTRPLYMWPMRNAEYMWIGKPPW